MKTPVVIANDSPAADLRREWGRLDQAGRNAAYDNNAAVADSARWIAKRNSDSAAYRQAHAGSLDIFYAASERTAFDLYPAAHADAPCLVFIHGGYWQRNSREVFACVAEGAAGIGWSVAIPGHTLAPQASLRGIVFEIGRALDWLAAHGHEYGIAGPVLLAGWSAGAQLAALHLAHPSVAAGLAVSGVFDLQPLRDTGLNRALALTDEEIRDFSPLRLPAIPKPLAIAFGSLELPALVHDARNFFAMRNAASAPGQLLPIAGADHFSILHELQRPDGALVRTMADLLQSR
jgi:acetyl esterase/lipase